MAQLNAIFVARYDFRQIEFINHSIAHQGNYGMSKSPVNLLFTPLVLTIVQVHADSRCEPWIAKLQSVQGKVELQQRGVVNWEIIHTGDLLCPGDKVRTATFARSTLQFRNNAVVDLDQNTMLILRSPKAKKNSWLMEILHGIGFFRSREPQEFDVETPFVNAVHKGTEFIVKVNAEQTEVTVLDGAVRTQNAQHQLEVQQGYVGIAKADKTLHVEALKLNPQDAVQWALYYPPLIDVNLNALPANSKLKSLLTDYYQGKTAVALEQLNSLPPTAQDSSFLNLHAGLLLSLGRVQEAESVIQQLQQFDPSAAYAFQAIIHLSKNQTALSLDKARQAVTLKPDNAIAHVALSYALQANMQLDEALNAAQQAKQFAPENALVWARLAELQLATGDYQLALASAIKAKTLNPQLGHTHTVLGFAHLLNHDTDAAQQAFQDAITLDSSQPLAHLGSGLVQFRRGDAESATQALETAVTLDANNALLRSYLGKSHYELKNPEYAAKEFELAKDYDQHDPTPWFYGALLKQSLNQPIVALQDMQKAIDLNDQRAVYRSRLMLDEDNAVRSASLGRIYKELGLDDVARVQATQALNIDPSNASAHRLLADSYFARPRQELARASEVLQAQLLQPLTSHSMSPQLAYSDLNIPKGAGFTDSSFNEYSRLFEGNQQRFTATGLYGSNDTRSDEAVISGIYDKLAYSVGQMHYQTDGFRPNADLKHNLYNVFAQYELTPQLSMQAEYRYRETEHGDIRMLGAKQNNFNDTNYRRYLQQDTYRFGSKYSPSQNSDFLVSYLYANRTEKQNSADIFNAATQQAGHQFESQYLYHQHGLNLTLGGGKYVYNLDDSVKSFDILNAMQYPNGQDFAYLYTQFSPINTLNVTAGVAYDHYYDNDLTRNVTVSQFSPKFGVQLQFNSIFTFRAAGFQTVKAPIVVSQALQPMQIAGFNQFFDDPNGVRATQYGVGLDIKPSDTLFLGIEAYKRDLTENFYFPAFEDMPATTNTSKVREELYRVYFNWMLHPHWALNSEARFENFHAQAPHPNAKVETAYLPLTIRYFNPTGFFADMTGQLVHQVVDTNPFIGESFNTNFMLLDAAVGYRFPNRYGMISLEAKNLLDKEFKYRDRSFQLNEYRSSDLIPQRLLFVRLSLNF